MTEQGDAERWWGTGLLNKLAVRPGNDLGNILNRERIPIRQSTARKFPADRNKNVATCSPLVHFGVKPQQLSTQRTMIVNNKFWQ